MSHQAGDRRKYPRFSAQGKGVWAKVLQAAPAAPAERHFSVTDACANGMCCHGGHTLPREGDRVALQVYLAPRSTPLFTAEAQVVRAWHTPPQGVGLHFARISDSDRAGLEQLLTHIA